MKDEVKNNDVHFDREEIMSQSKIQFSEAYEQAITNLAREVGITQESELGKKLKEKRDFGLQKYGARSFQSSFENALSSPTELDVLEELVDVINYSLHLKFQELFKKITYKGESSREILADSVRLYTKVSKYMKDEENS